MRGLLTDVNVQGQLSYVLRLLDILDLWEVLEFERIEFAVFSDVGLAPDADDRRIWNFCQAEGWVLLTDNRNEDGPDSLQATLNGMWRFGHLPVITISNRKKFARLPTYAGHVVAQLAEVLYGIAQGEYRDQPRIFIPF